MNPPAEQGRGVQEQRGLHRTGHSEEQAKLLDYASTLGERAATTGQDRAQRADPDEFDRIVEEIRSLADIGYPFAADDVTAFDRRGVVGAAFAHLKRSGEIEVAGYAISRRPERHGGLVRQWRRAAP